MPTWTDTSLQTLQRHLAAARQNATRSGADPDEVEADIRRHIETELGTTQKLITQADVEAILTRLGLAASHASSAEPVSPAATNTPAPKDQPSKPLPLSRSLALISALVFGVLTPLLTLGFELYVGICRELFADPLPTPFHILVVLAVPLSNLLGLLASEKTSPRKLKFLQWLNAWTLGFTCVYAAAFLPLSPFALVAVIYLGLGLLPLSPITSFIVALRLRKRLRLLGEKSSTSPTAWWPKIAFALLIILALEAPTIVTTRALQTLENNPNSGGWHLSWLRSWPWENTLTIEGEGGGTRINGHTLGSRLAGWIWKPISARTIAIARYRASGLETSSRPRTNWRDRGSFWDDNQGTEHVGTTNPHLFLKESKLDGLIDPNALHGYLEWTLVFRNDDPTRQAEARCQIALPSGGTVSRLTLWINDVPQEAAFGGRSTVKQAYHKVVRVLNRDPAMVTTSGPDRILFQCFPIAPRGKEMKVRFGITFPLQLTSENAASGRFMLPRLIEQNFQQTENLSHNLWLDSWGKLNSPLATLQSAQSHQPGTHILRGEIARLTLENDALFVSTERSPDACFTWTEGLNSEPPYLQRIIKNQTTARPLALVIDGSAHLREHLPKLIAALRTQPDLPLRYTIFAGDELLTCPETKSAQVASWLEKQTFIGGQDCTAALTLAAEKLLSLETHATILWIHGPQAQTWQDSGALAQILERRPGQIHIIEATLVTGPNCLIAPTPNPAIWSSLTRSDKVSQDIFNALQLSTTHPAWKVTRSQINSTSQTELRSDQHTSSHLRRLAVLDEVNRLYARDEIDAAGALAAKHQLVTAVSGAVVLETKKQYDEAGLKQGAASSSPAVPEPATYAFFGAATLLLAIYLRKRRIASTGNARSFASIRG